MPSLHSGAMFVTRRWSGFRSKAAGVEASGSEGGSVSGMGGGSCPPNRDSTDGTQGRFRWAVNSSEWTPAGEEHGEEFRFLLSLIREERERAEVLRYAQFADKKRALLSRLMSRRASAAVLGLTSFADIEIGRTRGKKPFLKAPRPPADRPDLANFNFNVSHEGDWVVLASEPLCICGVDVSAPVHYQRPVQFGDGTVNIYKDFLDFLTPDEWRMVRRDASFASKSVPEGERGFQAFQHCWSAKESFVKARGDGLAFDLGRAGFSFEPCIGTGRVEEHTLFKATLAVDGEVSKDWRFFQQCIGGDHWVTVARGPTHDVCDEDGHFKATLTRATSTFTRDEWQCELYQNNPGFDCVPVTFLVPEDELDRYFEAIGSNWQKLVSTASAFSTYSDVFGMYAGLEGALDGDEDSSNAPLPMMKSGFNSAPFGFQRQGELLVA